MDKKENLRLITRTQIKTVTKQIFIYIVKIKQQNDERSQEILMKLSTLYLTEQNGFIQIKIENVQQKDQR